MYKEIQINLNIEFPKYEDMKSAIKEYKQRWDKDDFTYTSDVTYDHLLCSFPGGFFRIYASEDTHFEPTFDDMRGGYVHSYKKFKLTKQGYDELIEYATEQIHRAIRCC